MKKLFPVFGIALLMILVFAITAIGFMKPDLSIFTNAGKAIRNTFEQSDADDIIAKINGIPVTKQDFEFQKVVLETGAIFNGNTKPITDDEVWEGLIRNTVLYEEAKKRGLVVPLEEGKAYASEMLNLYYLDEPIEGKDQMVAYIKALGMTPEEYFESVAPESYRRGLAIGKLRQEIHRENNIDPNDSSLDTFNKREEVFNNFADNLVAGANVEKN